MAVVTALAAAPRFAGARLRKDLDVRCRNRVGWRPLPSRPATRSFRKPGRMRTHTLRARLFAVSAFVVLAGCGPAIEGLRDSEGRSFTLEPVRVRPVVAPTDVEFGVCDPFVFDRTGLPLGATFAAFERLRGASISGVAGHEVQIRRGQSCHKRYVITFQTLVDFELGALPAGAVSRAWLTMRGSINGGVDPPRLIGSPAQCNNLRLGRATAWWHLTETRGLVPWEELHSPPPAFVGGVGPFDVTRTVNAWKDRDQPNFGFVVAPDPAAVDRNASTIEQTDQEYMCPMMLGGFQLEIQMIVRR